MKRTRNAYFKGKFLSNHTTTAITLQNFTNFVSNQRNFSKNSWFDRKTVLNHTTTAIILQTLCQINTMISCTIVP